MLALLGIAYLLEGFLRALLGPLPQDLARRWLENAYFVRGIDSLDVYAGTRPVVPEIGVPHAGGYPPWSLPVALVVAPPVAHGFLQAYFAVLNVLALATVVWFARRAARRHGPLAANLVTASTAAIAANAVVLRNGQYGLLINAFLVGVLVALETRHPLRAGAWLAIAALKPQSSGPFGLLLLDRRHWPGVFSAAAVLAVFAFGAASWLGSSPLHMLSQVFGQASNWEGGDAGPLRLLLAAGVPRGAAIAGLAGVVTIGSAALLHVHRARSLLVQAAIACVGARLWAYHRRYDDVLLVFLLLPLALDALERSTKAAWVAFVAVGLTLWLPLREVDHGVALIALKVVVWGIGLCVLLRSPYGRPEAVPSPARSE
ncbi:MAG TPA: glycosyltransferase family 87 protein [Polyangiaceae bacterium]